MKVRVINEKNSDFEKEFKVRRMNYDQTVVNYPNSKGINIFLNKDLEFITESEIDEFLVQHKYFLKIKLNRGISIYLYKILLDMIQEQLKSPLLSLNLLKDKHKINKRGIWDKEIICIVNEKTPISIIANGENFKKSGYNIVVEEIKVDEFLDYCTFEIEKLKKEIEEKQSQLFRVERAVKQVNSRDESVELLE